MPRYWMVSNRNVTTTGFGGSIAPATFWVADNGPTTDFAQWRSVTSDQFKQLLLAEIAQFPLITDPDLHEDQRHVNLFIHGFNNSWTDAAGRYSEICDQLFSGPTGMGLCILFSWPSKGSPAEYLPDRSDARQAAPALADVLSNSTTGCW